MLQQILREMWVAPEILAELDETQKQTLFCKMREEQVRRWRTWDQKLTKQEESGITLEPSIEKKRIQKKAVHFLLGENDEPWVWVMGEHEDDKSIEQILEEEALENAHNQALKETEELRKSVEKELGDFIEYNSEQMNSMEKDCILLKQLEKIEDIYCSVDELREKMKNMSPEIKTEDAINNSNKSLEFSNNFQLNNKQNNYKNNITNFNIIEGRREILQEINPNKDHKVSARVALWERRVTEQRTGEILKGIRHRKAQALKEAEEMAPTQQLLWEEQERRAKEAEIQIREIARRAREEHKRNSVINSDSSNTENSSIDSTEVCYMDPVINLEEKMKPPSRDAIINWFKTSEIPREVGLDEDGNPAKWFHGLITRIEAENLLRDASEGSYLVRVSERIWGYAISYRASERCKHYLIDASQSSHYQFLGNNQITHKTLANLVSYHKKHVITEAGKEILLTPCETTAIPQIMQKPS
ncbi:SH2 domain-containing protein 4A-like isoform X2 [Arctopsyche grandis]|uniref:SH2 domain-containing protein 4A-like isoform X2 n=1 Tax=Arctopsyche grandis TaxID=121162 RepID=UPI00406D7200